jgi:hypothetical protein
MSTRSKITIPGSLLAIITIRQAVGAKKTSKTILAGNQDLMSNKIKYHLLANRKMA